MIRLSKILVIIIFALYFSRAFFVMVLMHDYYADLAKNNQIRTEVIPAPRGVISDASGKIIAGNIKVDDRVVRNYPDGEVVASVVGYLNQDGTGVTGLEKQYDAWLTGQPGERLVEETASGKDVAEVKRTEPVPGKELKLNLDLPLTETAYRLLKQALTQTGKSGAVVVSRTNGDILALVSLPAFDPNLFIAGGKRGDEGGVYPDAKGVVADDARQPLFNRAISGMFAPGSVFKLVTSLSGLQEKVIGRDDLLSDSGEIVIGPYRYGNWLFDKFGRTEGAISIEKAIARSNDVFFYKLGEKIGVDKLVYWADKLGMGQQTGVDLPAEAAGLLPSPLWMEKQRGNPWFLGNTYHLAIGQGDLLTTPLQINQMTAETISGKRCRSALKQVDDKYRCEDLGLTTEARNIVFSGMRQACEAGGTAFPFYDLKGLIICKTGTAQHGSEKDLPHAWLTAVVPVRTQELKNSKTQELPDIKAYEDGIVVTVMIESGGEGSEVAAPVARKIVDYILSK